MDDVTREPVDRELRRRQLARRLVAHEARTGTVFRLTGLSRHQQETLRKRWGIPQERRRRGEAPTSFASFRSNSRAREEAAALAVIWKCAGVSRASRQQSQTATAAVELGEQLCDAFEIYRACLLKSKFSFEHLDLLARGLEEGGTIALSNCGNCQAVILLDLLEARRNRCSQCQELAKNGESPPPPRDADVRTEYSSETTEAVQRELF
jgi:hypothetical protein